MPRQQVVSAITHLRQLYRKSPHATEAEARAHDKREAVAKNLIDNIARTGSHPTLHTVLEVADIFSLTLQGSHRLFGYNLDRLRHYDAILNNASTRIIEHYAFERDLPIDLPHRFHEGKAWEATSSLHQLVSEWQHNVPIGAIDREPWRAKGTFYVQVGTLDSLGTSLPPGSIAMVEPISEEELLHPSPRSIYLLQFGNGYRCSRCVTTRGKLLLLTGGKHYTGPQEFRYPGQVRIVGRVRLFAIDLPTKENPLIQTPAAPRLDAPLALPWEHRSLHGLLATEYARFQRMRKGDGAYVRDVLENAFGRRLSSRTEKRYRGQTTSQPHIDVLIQMTMISVVRYRDALRAAGVLSSDRRRYSLETLLAARQLADVTQFERTAGVPQPITQWQKLQHQFVEWPTLLSQRFPRLRDFEGQVVRLPETGRLQGIEPQLVAGTIAILDTGNDISDVSVDPRKPGWQRPIYMLQRGTQSFLGFLRRDAEALTLFSGSPEVPPIALQHHEIPLLRRVAAIAVPV
ncbi:hypothetical protein [Terriglobus sp. TAA 43]|uniref:hypothetical protein n=1 Tax=Terriglobus sp. TAA 43 TaxID=278961 RepID=UPI0018DDC360|nr:hypothetical protein [Terriglobus sp. TAA 43]